MAPPWSNARDDFKAGVLAGVIALRIELNDQNETD